MIAADYRERHNDGSHIRPAGRAMEAERGTTTRGDPHTSDPADFHPGPGSPDDVYIIVLCLCLIRINSASGSVSSQPYYPRRADI
ncbi:hypothetical protein Y032_0483g2291 [Ancylostoma ceylanicum]|uniref:Uncharacterized protein n=1 Tax=Ancylostoma ceylanicum TaxID=53326 RepID=A0A016WXF1_9BILA|nr:hypothetical protein Y032_0483g2291 [Ancylostoma ceylanicum]